MVVIINMSIILAGIFGEMENYHYLQMVECSCPIEPPIKDKNGKLVASYEFDCNFVNEIQEP